ncbi:hypothetical protein D3C80_2181600 [compost metagenome]
MRGDTDAPALKVGQGDFVAFALLAQAIGQWHANIIEDDLTGIGGVLTEFVFNPRHLITG